MEKPRSVVGKGDGLRGAGRGDAARLGARHQIAPPKRSVFLDFLDLGVNHIVISRAACRAACLVTAPPPSDSVASLPTRGTPVSDMLSD